VLVLVVDTATPAVQAAVCRLTRGDAEPLAWRRVVNARAHGELLGPAIKEVLDEASVGPGELAAVVAGTGPGPFTGLRVGLVTAAAMSQALGIPAYGVCSLDGIGAATTGHTLVATDARRKEVYWARYVDGTRVAGPGVGRPELVGAQARAAGASGVAGEAATRYADALGLPVVDGPSFPELKMLARLAAERVVSGKPSEVLTPLYLRRPDATEPGRPKPVGPGARQR